MHRSLRNGFTLVDLILSLSIIGILLAVMLVQYKPGERILNANVTVMMKESQDIEKAIALYISETGEDPGDGDIEEGEENKKYICAFDITPAEQEQVDCVKLDELETAGFLPELPRHFEWSEEDDDRVIGYTVYWSGGSAIIGGPLAE